MPYPCRQLLCFPKGNNQRSTDFVSLYLAVPDEDQHPGWCRSASFKLIVRSRNGGVDHSKDSQHNFTAQANDWGEPGVGILRWSGQPAGAGKQGTGS